MSPERVRSQTHFVREGFLDNKPVLPPALSRRKSFPLKTLRERFPLRYNSITYNHPEISSSVLERRLSMLNNLDEYITKQRNPNKQMFLREPQLAVFSDIRDFLEQGNTEGYVEAPTGFGKTVVFSEIVKATDEKTVIVVPTQLLVEQTYQKIKQFNPDMDIGRMYADKKETGKKVTITTFQSLVLKDGGVNPEDIDLLILDEVHQSLTDKRINAVGKFKNAVKLGFTATPEYTKDKRVESLLNNEIHVISLKEAVAASLLSPFSVYLAETNVDISNVKVNKDRDYDEKELERAINIYSRNKSAVELYKQFVEGDDQYSKAVVYCVSVNHAKEVARVFSEEGINAEAIWSSQDSTQRKKIMDRFKQGEVKILTNVNLLTEGFDDTQVALCLNLKPTLSRVVAKQRGGRVLRLDSENADKHAVIVDFMDQDENKKNLQITFAQVAEGAEFLNKEITEDVPLSPEMPSHVSRRTTRKSVVNNLVFDVDSLKVTTNSEEVLKIIREMESSHSNFLLPVQEEDYVLSYNNVRNTFRGGPTGDMYSTAIYIASFLAKEDQSLVVKRRLMRKHGESMPINVITDRERFIEEMKQYGFIPKEEELFEIQELDFELSTENIRLHFVRERASEGRLHSIYSTVLRKIRETNPELIKRRRKRKSKRDSSVEVTTDKNLFVKMMIEHGATLRKEINENDFLLSTNSLLSVFVDTHHVKEMASEVVEEMKNEDDSGVFQVNIHGATVNGVHNKQDFINRMLVKGAKLNDPTIEQLQPGELPTRQTFELLFKGTYQRWRNVAEEVAEQLLIEGKAVRRRNGVRFVTAILDRKLFYEQLLSRGAHSR